MYAYINSMSAEQIKIHEVIPNFPIGFGCQMVLVPATSLGDRSKTYEELIQENKMLNEKIISLLGEKNMRMKCYENEIKLLKN